MTTALQMLSHLTLVSKVEGDKNVAQHETYHVLPKETWLFDGHQIRDVVHYHYVDHERIVVYTGVSSIDFKLTDEVEPYITRFKLILQQLKWEYQHV